MTLCNIPAFKELGMAQERIKIKDFCTIMSASENNKLISSIRYNGGQSEVSLNSDDTVNLSFHKKNGLTAQILGKNYNNVTLINTSDGHSFHAKGKYAYAKNTSAPVTTVEKQTKKQTVTAAPVSKKDEKTQGKVESDFNSSANIHTIGPEDVYLENQNLIFKIAQEYSGYGISIDDLLAAAREGLYRGATKLDTNRPKKQQTDYLCQYIRESVRVTKRNESNVTSIPKERYYEVIDFIRTRNALFNSLNRHPNDQEVKEKLDIDDTQYVRLLSNWTFLFGVQSINEAISTSAGNKDGDLYPDVIAPNTQQTADQVIKMDLQSHFNSMILCLTPNQREVIEKNFGLGHHKAPMSMPDVAASMNLGKYQCDKIKKAAIIRLKEMMDRADISLDDFAEAGVFNNSDEMPVHNSITTAQL